MNSGKKSDVQPEYDLAKLGKGTRGKYFKSYQERGNAVPVDGDDTRSRRKAKQRGSR